MPYSADENRDYVIQKVQEIDPREVLDVGAGSGTYADLLRAWVAPGCVITGLEVWEPYVERFNLRRKYDLIEIEDVRERNDFLYDLVIFGDVLEHMTKEEALAVWGRVSKEARWAMISIPIVHYPQGAEEGNPYEVHVQDHITPAELIKDFGPFDCFQIFDVTGTFFRRFR